MQVEKLEKAALKKDKKVKLSQNGSIHKDMNGNGDISGSSLAELKKKKKNKQKTVDSSVENGTSHEVSTISKKKIKKQKVIEPQESGEEFEEMEVDEGENESNDEINHEGCEWKFVFEIFNSSN